MICLFDAGFIHILFDDKARIARDARGKLIVDHAQDRIDFLVQTISEKKDNKIILPTPALAEFMLLAADRWADYLTIIRRRSIFEIAGFDDPEAVELVEHWRKFGDGKRLKAGTPETWAKLKYDRQIAAIARTRRVERIYSTDADLEKYAEQLGIKYLNLPDLVLPPTSPQQELQFEEPDGDIQPSGDGHAENQAGDESAAETADGKEAGKE